ncbi:2-hydroxyacyl-CoA dehydratase subunit D [Ferroglobus sp.]|uniref:2-hydroxyacyl-CoA dehydratase subunit D n=1 Tax=Ferroglobus sp. TaxID=2614230 RepID=UPI0025C066A4|nr:2-hydroxyacyl-CoA dehydratase family protein [Ferroglobus sp.]
MISKIFQEFFVERRKIEEYRRRGKKIIGTMCNTVPEEVIHAFGAVPIRLFGVNEFKEVYAKFPSWMCSYSRGVMEDALRGFKVDGVVSSTTDDTKIHLFSSYTFYVKPDFSYLIQFPFVKDELSFQFFKDELERFSLKLANFLKVDIDEKKLRDSVKIYNEYRILCSRIDSLRSMENPKVSGSEFLSLMLISQQMLKEDFLQIARDFYREAERREGREDYKIRVHVSGTDFTDVNFLRNLEEWGLAIVSDDFCTSAAYYSGLVDDSSIESVAKRYFSICSCTMSAKDSPIDERIEFISRRIEKSEAEAAILMKERGCEICGHQCSWIVRELNVPVLVLDYEYPISIEQYKTRVEAFIESFGR